MDCKISSYGGLVKQESAIPLPCLVFALARRDVSTAQTPTLHAHAARDAARPVAVAPPTAPAPTSASGRPTAARWRGAVHRGRAWWTPGSQDESC